MTTYDPKKKRRSRTKVDDAQKARWAIERFSGKLVEVRELAARHERSAAVVSRAITSAFAEGLVEVRRVQHEQVQRLSDLEAALRRRFPVLRGSIVVDVADGQLDVIHERLGQALAQYLFDRVWSDEERILVGAGRCVYHMAERLGRLECRLRPKDITLISVCGDSYPYHDEKRNVCLDADANVNCLAQSFEQSVSMGLTSRPIFANEEDKVWRRQYFDKFWEHRPTLGILGVGVFDAKHQLVLLTDPVSRQNFPPANIPASLTDKVQRLFDLSKLCVSRSRKPHYPVAEIGMRLFCIEPVLAESDITDQVADNVRALVAEVNGELFSPDDDLLAAVRSIILVGGGIEKAAAFRNLLENAGRDGDKPSAFQMVCVDKQCARYLIKS